MSKELNDLKSYLPDIEEQVSNIEFLNGNSILSAGSFKSQNFRTGQSGWELTAKGDLEANSGTFRGDLIAGSLHIPDQDTTANSFHVQADADTWWGATETNFDANNDNAKAYVLKTGVAKFQEITLSNNVTLIGLQSGSEISIQGWQHDMAFTASDNDTVAWASGTITLMDGTTYSITGANTGNMAAITYIYLDTAVSTTALQTTTTASSAVGSGKILVAVAQNVTSGKSAVFQVFGGKALGGLGKLIVAGDITAATITANEIAANTITANEINVSQLSAIAADLGTVTAGTVTGATLRTAASGSRINMDTTSLVAYDDAAAKVFEVLISGADVGDVIIGDYAGNQGIKYDKSAGTISYRGVTVEWVDVADGASTKPDNNATVGATAGTDLKDSGANTLGDSDIMNIRSMTAGETINGATLPVAVYQNTTDNEVYACDGNDTTKLKFIGFAISNSTDGVVTN